MKLLSVLVISAFSCFVPAQQKSPAHKKPPLPRPRLMIAECVEDGIDASMPEFPLRERIARLGDIELEASFTTDNVGATFWFMRDKKEIFRFTANDIESDSLWIAVDHDRYFDGAIHPRHVAITYGQGGAIGIFQVRVFNIDTNGVKDVSTSINVAVSDFKSRHYCKARGNNVTALKWIRGSLLLMTEVYPTGDCGLDLGHVEGYLVSVPSGEILEHLTLQQLQRYPGVCLENDDGT
jgi:hypothetical protein